MELASKLQLRPDMKNEVELNLEHLGRQIIHCEYLGEDKIMIEQDGMCVDQESCAGSRTLQLASMLECDNKVGEMSKKADLMELASKLQLRPDMKNEVQWPVPDLSSLRYP
jgi:hypothetical protein